MLPLDFILFLQIIIFMFITPGTPRIVIISYSMNYGVQKCIWTALGDVTANITQATLVIFVIGSFLFIFDLICFLEYSNFFLCFILCELALFLHSLNDEGFKDLLIMLITSLSVLPVYFSISSKVILSAHAAHMTQSGLSRDGSGFLTLVVGL